MHHTTVVTLMYLMFGQLLILTFGVFVLWWVGDFSDTSESVPNRRQSERSAEPPVITLPENGKLSRAQGEVLLTLVHDHSIQPKGAEGRLDRESKFGEHKSDVLERTERAEKKTLSRSVG